MATPCVEWWLTRWLPLLVSFLLFHPALTLTRNSSLGGAFQFTQPTYNATIMENSMGKTLITPASKMGIYYSAEDVNVKFKVVGGDGEHTFRAATRQVGDFWFMQIRIRSNLHGTINRESVEGFTLRVKAVAKFHTEPTLIAEALVMLKVLDANDLSPLFYPTTYNVSVAENAVMHSTVVHVTASDADVGVNGEVYYSFEDWTETFAIHPTTGLVTVTCLYFEKNEYRLTVLAHDRGPKHESHVRYGRADLVIRVHKVNFHPPQIDVRSLPAITEHGKIGTIYAVLYVDDNDYGSNGDIQRVAIASGDPDGFMELVQGSEDTEYKLQVAKELDREAMPAGLNLTIEAVDRGQPSRTSQETVYVNLRDVNDQAPVFEMMNYTTTVMECVPHSTPLLFVTATDADEDENGRVSYSIHSGNELGWFRMDSSSGLLLVSSRLDYELVQRLTIQVMAQDHGNYGNQLSSITQVTIIILDCNDNAPEFSNASMAEVLVSENVPVGSEVTRVVAHDRDDGDNGRVSYSISNIHAVPFTVDHFTGVVRTKQVLDYETMRRVYSLVMRASDWGTPYRHETEMILKIRLRDVNDYIPEFERVDCVGYLSREAPVGTQLVVVSAIDFDVGDLISYSILDGDSNGCFVLDSLSGVLTTNCQLLDWEQEAHSISIVASDGVHVAEAITVNISFVNNNRNLQLSDKNSKITCRNTSVTTRYSQLLSRAKLNNLDVEDEMLASGFTVFSQNLHVPRFQASTPKLVSVSEGVPVGFEVLSLTALDEDHGYNGLLSYVISGGNEGSSFRMDTHTGNLVVLRELDRERRDRYSLNITVTDAGQIPKSSHTLLNLAVTDVNDNAPVFDEEDYSVTIPESTPINRTIVQVAATDDDRGINAGIHFSILTDTSDFVIDRTTGMIRVNSELDRERIPVYELTIVATDDALHDPLSSSVSVTINLADINDNPPVFIPENYHVRVREDLPVGQVVLSITAKDADLGAAGTVRYSITDGMDQAFSIDRVSGTIRISTALDYEVKRLYNISAKARDRGSPPLSARCFIIVEVVDVNENMYAPSFKDFVFEGHVKENRPLNSSVLQLLATDADVYNDKLSPADYWIEYSIIGGSGLGWFTIDSTGEISTHAVLDRESTPHYWLRVMACDHGTVPLCTTVDVYIVVDDENDNVPQTATPMYHARVPENSRAETEVVRLEASDPDGNQLTYAIEGGDPQGFFTMDSSGVIRTSSRRLDREKQAEHILEVRVRDDGIPPLSSTTRVVVLVMDVNDNDPHFLQSTFRVRVPAVPDTGHDVPLYRVIAYDLDYGTNASIEYSIRPGKLAGRFSMNPRTGMLFTRKELLADSQYEIMVQAQDGGQPAREASVRLILTVVDRLVSSIHAPRFDTETSRVETEVMENAQVGTMVVIMRALDEDGEKFWFSITGGNHGDAFYINPENGNIMVARLLDWETRSEYNLTVNVTDSVHSVATWVHIQVIYINEHEPEFSQQVYETSLSEFAPPGTEVLTLHATDRDEDKRLFFTILSASDQSSLSKFSIVSDTGVLLTRERLDREATSRHELTVMVRDQGVPSKRSLARVVLHVTDENDHAPAFVTTAVTGEVYSTAEVGTTVARVLAVDHDHGLNAEVKYTLVAGNVGSAFSMSSHRGILAVAKPLYSLSHSEYHLIVRASDSGVPSLSSTATITVQVTIPMDAPPMFAEREYTAEMSENESEGTFILAVQAKSQCSLLYDIVTGNELGYFGVNPSSGVIYNLNEIDYELTPFFNLTVSATNLAQAQAFTQVLIHIRDENDNRPEFTRREYLGIVSERALPGSVILDEGSNPLVIKAMDNDTKLNALLYYSIVEMSARAMFDIDPSTGAMRTRVLLDHEVASVYEFSVIVRDSGDPQLSMEEAAHVVVHVLDVNDSPPQFSRREYSVTLLVPTYAGVEVMTLEATDADTGVNSSLTFMLDSGNQHSHFYLDRNTGTILVQHGEDLLDSYRLNVRVTDGSFEDTAIVIISVDFIQDNGLSFSHNDYYVEVMEGVREREQVALVQAVGQALNEHLTFTILNPTTLFEIGATSGVVETTGQALDRETRDNYTIVVEVRDQRPASRVAHTAVYVVVLDANDNTPVFINQPYFAIVPIDAPIGHVVMKVKAVDLDADENGELLFSLMEAHPLFAVNATSGEITVNETLSLEQQNKEYILTVQASDQGIEPLTSYSNVTIRVMSKATPIFRQLIYLASVREDIPLHSVVATVQADSPTGGKLVYSISGGDRYDEFAVHFNTGALTLVEELDYELISHYQLTVRASDIDTGSFADTIVDLHLLDVNDNAPSFTSLHYFSTVSEAVSLGTSILSVTAVDEDTENNAQIHYTLSPSPDRPTDIYFFHMDRQSGVIHVQEKLDRERSAVMELFVVAVDRGFPALSASVPVTIMLTDLNDNPPRFHSPTYPVTISDLATRGQFVTVVVATDADSSDVDNLVYSIVGGNDGDMFVIGETTGIVTLSNLRKPQLKSAYLLNISVTDEVFTSFTSIEVTVESSNQNAPIFPTSMLDVDIVENMAAGHFVVKVTANDRDVGVYGNLTYWILNEDALEFFRMNQSNGEIYTLERMDREDRSMYMIAVAARDGGGRVAHTTVRVNIADQADERPQFKQTQYKSCIYSTAEVDSLVLKIEAMDHDLGPNGELEYRLVDSEGHPATDVLDIDQLSGVIRVSKPLADKQNEMLQFFVRVEDRGSPPLHAVAPVDVYIMAPDDLPPVFPADYPSYFINENIEKGTVIATVTAESNESLTYSIISGETPSTNNPVKFTIDDRGKISVFEALDREELEMLLQLTIRAETRSSPPLVAHTQVYVKLMDVNDNSPQFESSVYEVTIAENSEVGSAVLQVLAHDDDEGPNGVVTYDFALDDAAMSNIMSVDPVTGWIHTLVELDRETNDIYSFFVVASDKGEEPLRSQVKVVVTVTDFNDEGPVFSSDIYKASVNEDALPGTIIRMVTTTDADIAPNNQVTYYLQSGDPLGQFNIRKNGEIYVNRALDRESKSSYDLLVAASDGAHVATANVQISILDANDNDPHCDQPLYQMMVAEDVETGTFLLRTTASDRDEAGSPNADIQYSLSGNNSQVFYMQANKGIISIKSPLDRESVAEYRLVVTATDGGGRYCTSDVIFMVTDVNDNAPIFSQPEYVVYISEDAEVNTLLIRVSASDLDLGLFRKVNYHLTDKSGTFRIDSDSGIVSLSKLLDRETQELYNVTLFAYDQGTQRLSSSAALVVHVTDVNDNAPEFEWRVYEVSVPENNSIGHGFVRVHATSLDTGINAQITYSIVEGNEGGLFHVDPDAGSVWNTRALDYETVRQHSITVLAEDGGYPSLSNQAVVQVTVLDSNDNPPVFPQSVYQVSVAENTAAGTSLTQVEALDADTPPHQQITYAIGSGDEHGQFSVDPASGIVRVAKPLDRESVPFYHLEVLGLNEGYEGLTGSTAVLVNLTDVNDCPPYFVLTNNTAILQVDNNGIPSRLVNENQPLGIPVMQVEVADDDLDPNGAPFTLDIIAGNSDNEFRISRDGTISTAAQFNRNIKDTYELTLRAYDNGSPVLFSETVIIVRIVEESAFPPQATPLTATVTAYECVFNGGVVGRVKATDQDVYDSLVFSLADAVDEEDFMIDEVDGTMSTVGVLDDGLYVINVSVSDGRHTVYTAVTLTVTCVTPDMAYNSVIVQFENLLPEQFISQYQPLFISTLVTELGVTDSDVNILSIQLSDTPGDGRDKRSSGAYLDVLVAVFKSQSKLYRGNSLRRRLEGLEDVLEEEMEVEVHSIYNEVCAKKNRCVKGDCVSEVHFYEDQLVNIITDSQSYVSASHKITWRCDCHSGYSGEVCDQQTQPCSPNPCPISQLCEEGADGSSYHCVCPPGLTGPDCDDVANDCFDSDCDGQGVTFTGNSYIGWHLTVPTERRLSLELEIKTVQNSARLMHAVGGVDYSYLELLDGVIQYRFDCGSGEGLARVSQIEVNDDRWHSVVVKRDGRNVKVVVDDQYTGEGNAPGTNDVLNLATNEVFFGAAVQVDDTQQGFVGCLKQIRIEGVELPLEGSSAVAVMQTHENVEFSCHGTFIPGICSSSPCHNGGLCIAYSEESLICQCQGHFTGPYCELSLFCDPNPCPQGAPCVDSIVGPVCQCPSGLKGAQCEVDVDECETLSPCQNGGTCFNIHGSFLCNCSQHYRGETCLDVISAIRSSSFNMTLEEICGIAGVVLALLVVVIIAVAIVRWQRRKKRREQQHKNEHAKTDLDDFLYIDDDPKVNHKMTNHNAIDKQPSPRPPPVPNRPASYTPSTADSVNTLNNFNFDTARNYGSAADELENMGSIREPIEIPEFLQNVDDYDVDSPEHALLPQNRLTQPTKWDPNIAENYKDDLKKQNKIMPSENQSTQSLQLLQGGTSACSLPISELEDEGQANNLSEHTSKGYHWDTSDWNPSNPLRRIAEVPNHPAPDSTHQSHDSNLHIAQDDYELTDYGEDFVDSEYVGDSEYCDENEVSDMDEDPNVDYPEAPNFAEILAMQGELNYDTEDEPVAPPGPRSYSLHPNHYLPAFNISQGSQDLPGANTSQDDPNANYGVNVGRDDDDDVIHYGFPRPGHANQLRPDSADFSEISDYNNLDYEPGAACALDAMSVSMGGYTSTNASVSDISQGICDIDDSEANLSDYDNSGEAKNKSHSHVHTQV